MTKIGLSGGEFYSTVYLNYAELILESAQHFRKTKFSGKVE